MQIKIITYNVWHGFHRDHALQRERLEAAQRAVAREKPDLLALNEACYGGPNSQNILMDYRELFAFKYGFFGGYSSFGRKKSDEGGNVLLSNLQMKAEVVPLSDKSAVRTRINLEDRVLTIDVIHPSVEIFDSAKIEALKPLLEDIKEPYILTGDFNALSPEDSYDKDELAGELSAFISGTPSLSIDDLLKRQLINWILSNGLRDAFNGIKRASTVPTRKKYGKDVKGMRVDYFFISDDIKVSDAYILKNEDTEIASDHYPIVGNFLI